MNIILLGHDDLASKIALRLIVGQLPEHSYRLFLSGPLAAGNDRLPGPLDELGRLDRSFYESLPWGSTARWRTCLPQIPAMAWLRYERTSRTCSYRFVTDESLNLPPSRYRATAC